MKESNKASIFNCVFSLTSPVKRSTAQARQRFKLLLKKLVYSSLSLLLGTTVVTSSLAAPPLPTAQGSIYRPILKLNSRGQFVSELQAALKLLGFYTGAVNGVYDQITALAVSQFQKAAGLSPNGIVDTTTWERLFPDETKAATSPNFTVPTQTTLTAASTEPKPAKPLNKAGTLSARGQKSTNLQQGNRRSQPTVAVRPTPPSEQIPGIQYTLEGFPILRKGMRGFEVIKLQRLLQKLGFLKGKVDGYFGEETEAAAIALQKRYGLKADGVVGAATWRVLQRQL
jgi:peptidoglycan hydrolase-like protein with peptidoglycan-binding domain